MGFILSLESDVTQPCPFWFEHSDSKFLVDFLVFERVFQIGNTPDVIRLLEERLCVSLSPILQSREEDFEWVPAEEFASCVRIFSEALGATPHCLDGITEPYFVTGLFLKDWGDLVKMAEWHLSHDAKKIRVSVM
jgi:hypothetical protein